jgi:hypothetical protein
MTWVGLDLHKRYITACAMSDAGVIVAEHRRRPADDVTLIGCSPDVMDPGYHLDNPDRSNAVISPTSYMEAVGCSLHQGKRDTMTIAFKMIGGSMARFDCANVNRDSIRSARRAYRDAVFAHTGLITSTDGAGGSK